MQNPDSNHWRIPFPTLIAILILLGHGSTLIGAAFVNLGFNQPNWPNWPSEVPADDDTEAWKVENALPGWEVWLVPDDGSPRIRKEEVDRFPHIGIGPPLLFFNPAGGAGRGPNVELQAFKLTSQDTGPNYTVTLSQTAMIPPRTEFIHIRVDTFFFDETVKIIQIGDQFIDLTGPFPDEPGGMDYEPNNYLADISEFAGTMQTLTLGLLHKNSGRPIYAAGERIVVERIGFQVRPVPEPASLMMLGSVALLCIRTRSNSRKFKTRQANECPV